MNTTLQPAMSPPAPTRGAPFHRRVPTCRALSSIHRSRNEQEEATSANACHDAALSVFALAQATFIPRSRGSFTSDSVTGSGPSP